MKKRFFSIAILILTLIECFSLFLMWRSNDILEMRLEEVKLKVDNTKNKGDIAIMISDGLGNYIESESSEFPKNMIYNSTKSGCIDVYGNNIANALTYELGVISVKTNVTSYCYIYFDKDTEAPVISNVSDAGNGYITFTVTDAHNDIDKFCVNTSGIDTTDCTWYNGVSGTQTTSVALEESNTYYVHVSDTVGNIGHSSGISVTVSKPVGEYLLNNPTNGLNTSLEGGLYRYQGTNSTVNNYICFGTSDKSTCTSDTDKYMYRIMGINSSGQLKLIKKEALNSLYAWDPSSGVDVSWEDSEMFSGLNEEYFLSNTTYVPSNWSGKIAITNWKYGDNTDVNKTALELYDYENSWSNTVDAKIGLWYLHDYYYGLSGGNNCSLSEKSEICKSAWIFLWNDGNDISATTATSEWTMSRHILNVRYCGAWAVPLSGTVGTVNFVKTTLLVRPTFFLTSEVEYLGGSGTITDPILVK